MSNLVFAQLGKELDRSSGSHLYTQVAGYLREKIASQELKSGDSLLPQRELSQLWGVSEITVRRAVSDLIREGVLVSRPGSGTFVAPGASDQEGGGQKGGGQSDPADGGAFGRPGQRSNRRSATDAMCLGVVVTSVTDGYPFFAEVVRGMRTGMDDGWSIQFFEQPIDIRSEPGQIPLQNLSGLILCSPVNLQLLARCQREGVAYVLIYNDLADGFSDCVFVDYGSGLLEAVSHLYQRGKRSIALVTAGQDRSSSTRMTTGYQMALRYLGLREDERWLMHSGYGSEHGHEATQQLLALGEDRPDAIIFGSDYQAQAGIVAAQTQNLSVPDDLAIVGQGNVIQEHESLKRLTTIDVHLHSIGHQATTLLRQQLSGQRMPGQRMGVTSELCIGDTT